MSNETDITDDEIREIVELLEGVTATDDPAARRGELGRAVRLITRLWADANPDFDGEAWYPISYMLTEHWGQIRSQSEAADLGGS